MAKKQCEVCKENFDVQDLYPLTLMNPLVIAHARGKIPDLDQNGLICFPDKKKINAQYFEKILIQDKGELTQLEDEVVQSLKQHEILSENINEEFEGQLTFGMRLADTIAQFGGSWTFITIFLSTLVLWMAYNSYHFLQEPFDPYPFILLNLVLSCLAAIQAPVIMMSQNRQTAKDRLSQESDYQVNLKSELQIRQLNSRLELFMKHQWEKILELSHLQDEMLKEIEKLNLK